MPIAVLAIIGAMTWSAVALLKHLTNKEYTEAVTLIVIVLVGVAVTFLVAASNFADGVEVNGHALGSLNAASLVMVGYAATSVLRSVYEFKKSFDGSDSAKESQLIPPATP